MRVFFVNRYYWPDESATSLMLTDLAEALAAAGHEIRVVASRQRLEEPEARLAPAEIRRGVHVHRLPGSSFGRQRLLLRALDYLSFYLVAALFLLRALRRGDVVVAMTDPPLMGVAAGLASRLRGARLINWLQDVYPEVAVRLGALRERSVLTWLLRVLRNRSLRQASANVVVGERMRDWLAREAPSATVHVVANWSPPLATPEVPDDANPYRRELGLQGRIVLGYSGNLGRAHEFMTLVEAAERLRARRDVHFLIIGGGAQLPALRQEVQRRGLERWSFLPYQPLARLVDSLGAADVHLVSLHPALEGLIVPSKIYGICAAGRPALFIGDSSGEVARLLRDYDCGLTIPTGDAAALAEAIQEMADDASRRRRLGRAARTAANGPLSFAQALGQWLDVLLNDPARPPLNSRR
jgi:colanic acid biosynthesis glycosyl transferase WcaI